MIQFFAVHNAILIGVLIFGVGVWAYFGNRSNPRNVALGALLIGAALWSFSHVLWRAAGEPVQVLFWARVMVFISLMLPVLFLLYVSTFFRGKLPSFGLQALAVMPNLVAFWFIFGSDRVVSLTQGGELNFGRGAYVLTLYFAVLFLASLLALFLVRRRGGRMDTRTMIVTLIGSVMAFSGIFVTLVASAGAYDLHAFWFSNFALALGVLLLVVPTVGKQMFSDLQLVGSETFIILSVTLIVTDVVVSEGILDFTFRLVLLIIIVFYGVITLRSLVREVHRLQQIEKLNSEISSINRSLVEVDKMKTRFLSFASHQLRAPLSGIFSYLSMMQDGDFGEVNERQKKVLAMNIEAMERLKSTIETFLDVSKIEMGGLELHLTDAHLEMLAADVVHEMSSVAERKGLELKLEVPEKLSSVMADVDKLYHALINLVDNGIKFTESGSVTVRVRQGRGRSFVEVEDTGKGMDRDQLTHVRGILAHGLEDIRFDKEGGSGLGLHVAQKIIEGHGGQMKVSSGGRGKGARFSFWVPRS